ncbi:MAG: SH3 domain-containing protein [Chloroflexota bacterium]
MNGNMRWLLILIAIVVLASLTFTVSAQDTISGEIALGQPLPSQLDAGATVSYGYVVNQLSQVTLQALGASAKPTITVLLDGTVVASQPNAENALTVNLTATLDPGKYVVQIGTLDKAAGLVVVVLQSETAVTSTPLVPANLVSGTVDNNVPLQLYSFTALDALDSYLYIGATSMESGVSARLVNKTTGQVSAQIESDVLGSRLHIPAGSIAYQVEIHQSAAGSTEPFTICLAPVSTGGCETGSAQVAQPTVEPPAATQEVFVVPTVASQDCTLTGKDKGGVNIRQSATTNSIITAKLPDGAFANVIGTSPDQQFYNVLYNGLNGWIALSVATTSGNCSGLLTINPPPAIVPTPDNSQPPPQPTASGPCRITVVAPTYIYQSTNANPSNLFDQAQPGAQLSPLGRLADNSWWQVLEYGYPQWLQTSTFGSSIQIGGDCSTLPIVSP